MNRKAAVLQLNSSDNISENISQIAYYLKLAKKNKVALVVLPENAFCMAFDTKAKYAMAETYKDGPIQSLLSQWADEFGLWIVAGTIPLKSNRSDRVYAASLVFNDSGICVARYDKIHLFDVRIPDGETHLESSMVLPGHKLVCIDTPIGRLGLSVCYDLRFPELYRKLVDKGVTTLVVSSAFTYDTGKAHWQTLLKARAIENQCFILAANQTGFHPNNRRTYGHSMIIEPWGNVLQTLNDAPGLIEAEIDLSSVLHLRKHFPCLKHRTIYE